MKLPREEQIELPDRRQFVKRLGFVVSAGMLSKILVHQTGCSGSQSERTSMPTRTEMKTALKDRISTDDPGNFNNNISIWDQIRLGIYYDEDKELVEIAIYETTSQAIGPSRFLPGPVWRNLIAQVGPANTPEQTIGPMMDAAARSAPRQPNDEGPLNDRPPRKPTLRSARKA